MRPLTTRIRSLLEWSGRYTKTDMAYLASGGFWLGLGQGVQMLFGLVLLVTFANLLPKETYGIYQFVLSVAGVISILTLTGMGTAIMRAASRDSSDVLRYGFRVQMLWSIGIVIAAGAAAVYYYLNGNAALGASFLIVGAFQPFVSGFSLYKDYLHGKRAFRQQASIEVGRRVIPLAALLATVLLTEEIVVIVLVYFAANALSLFIAYLIAVRLYPGRAPADESIVTYGKHLSFIGSISKVSEYLDKILVWHFLGAAAVAAYTLAQMPIAHLKSGFQLGHTLAFPKLAQKDFRQLVEALPGAIRRYFYVVCGVVIAYVLAAPYLFAFFFPAYAESVIYSQLLALLVLGVPRALIGQLFTAHEMKKELYILNLSTPLIRVALLGLFLPFYGIMGAIGALLLSELYVTVLQWYLFERFKKRLELARP